MEKKFIIIMASIILLLSITLGALLIAGPGINLNFDGIRNISLPEIGLFSNNEEDAAAPNDAALNDSVLNDVSDNIERSPYYLQIDGVWLLRLAGHHWPGDPATKAMDWAAQEIYNRTDGAIRIEHFPSGILGDSYEIVEDVVAGRIDMFAGFTPTFLDKMTAILMLPHLVTDFEDGKHIWTYGSNFFTIVNELAEENNLKLIGILPSGFAGIGTTTQFDSATVWDYDRPSRELLIRIPPFREVNIMAEIMQLRTTEIPFVDVSNAFSTGFIDGWIGGDPELNYIFVRNEISYFYDFRYINESAVIVINKELFYSMPEILREIIFEVMQEASIRVINEREERSTYYLHRMRNAGITVFQPTDAQREQMQEVTIRRGWPMFADEFGIDQDVLDRLLEDIR